MDTSNEHVSVDAQLCLRGAVSKSKTEPAERIYVENMKDPVEVLPPGGDRLLIILRVQEPRYRISFAHLDDTLLDLSQSSVIVAW